jgi:hypothetical protein
MGFEIFCMTLIALLVGLVITFGGYRLFLILLPIWGFFFGFGLGAQTLQVIFGIGFLATITSWVVGFIVGAIFAVLSYLFYIVAVALISGSFGYGLTVAVLTGIGLNFGFIVWLIAIMAAIAVALVVVLFNLQKYAIIIITAIGGTGAIIFTLLAAFGDLTPAEILLGPVWAAISSSFWWLLFFLAMSIAGIVVQLWANRSYQIESYDHF